MAIITDPDLLARSSADSTGTPDGEVFLNLTNKTIELISQDDDTGGSPTNFSSLVAADGVTLQCLYSFLKNLWKTESDLIKYPFPMEAITAEQFEFINGWGPDDTNTATRSFIRTGGWAEKDSAGTVLREYMGVITLGNIETNHKAYFAWDDNTTKTDFTYFGPVNQAIKIYETSGTAPAFGAPGAITTAYDNRAKVLTTYIRSAPDESPVVGYTFGASTTTSIGATTVTNQVYRFPLSEAVDIKITENDTTVGSSAPYTDMNITYYTSDQAISVGANSYNFGVLIDANVDNSGDNPTAEQIYMFVQYQLRQTSDIDAGAASLFGVVADPLLTFVGDNLKTVIQAEDESPYRGVAIVDYNNNDINRLTFVDNTGTERNFPFSASVTLNFSQTLVDDPNSKYFLFYTTNPSGNYGTGNAFYVSSGTYDAASPDQNIPVTGDLHYQTFTPTQGAASGTSDGTVSGKTFTVSGAGWGDTGSPEAGDLDGQILYILDGPNAGFYTIASHTATVITVTAPQDFETDGTARSWSLRSKNTTGNIQFTYDYDLNEDGGRTKATDAGVTLVAIGLNNAQYSSTTGTISRTETQTISITSALERNYSDPA